MVQVVRTSSIAWPIFLLNQTGWVTCSRFFWFNRWTSLFFPILSAIQTRPRSNQVLLRTKVLIRWETELGWELTNRRRLLQAKVALSPATVCITIYIWTFGLVSLNTHEFYSMFPKFSGHKNGQCIALHHQLENWESRGRSLRAIGNPSRWKVATQTCLENTQETRIHWIVSSIWLQIKKACTQLGLAK